MIKFKKIVSFQIERYPDYCAECPAYFERPYQCHNERGMEGDCALGYMASNDMRDYNSRCLFGGCKIREDDLVTLMEDGEKDD